MARIMNHVDAHVAPSSDGDNLLLSNLVGHPCVALPNGFSKNRIPTSIMFIGRLFGEAKPLAMPKTYQDATAFHLKHPTLSEK